MTTIFYVFQYVPDALMDERINFGVIVYSGNSIKAQFTDYWERIYLFSEHNIDFLKDFADEIMAGTDPTAPETIRLTPQSIANMQEWNNSIQLFGPHSSLDSIDETLQWAAERLLVHKRTNSIKEQIMSRAYNAYIKISEFDLARKQAIIAAAKADWTWDFDDWTTIDDSISSAEDGSLSGGESEEEFVERVTHDIWTANGGFCVVQIEMTYLENLPFETYELDKDDYTEWLAAAVKAEI